MAGILISIITKLAYLVLKPHHSAVAVTVRVNND